MKEQIGKVTLDYTFYAGEDFYCDGAVEDELLQIVTSHEPEEFPRLIEEKKSWPILYHLSHLRGNIVEWVKLQENAKVLEVGSGCGAITATLAEKAAELTCIDLSKKRSLINANRNKKHDHITIFVGNFKDIEPTLDQNYDAIFLIGVLEYGQLYIDGETPYEDFMRILYRHLKPGGQIIVAIENKYGMKYWAGCREDHLGTFFSSIEDYNGKKGIRTFSKSGLEQILRNAGINQYTFYYPYPDYKFMSSLYSDAYLPKKGELSKNICNYDRSRLLLFDENEAFDGILQEGQFPFFSNSFLVVIGKETDTKYVKYSNDRAVQFCIRTEIAEDEKKQFFVRKIPTCKQAREHVDAIYESFKLLERRFEGSGLSINTCWKSYEGVRLAYLQGETLEEQLDHLLDASDEAGFEKLIQRYLHYLSYHNADPVSDFDLIFSNIIVCGDSWTVIDYEWTKRQQIPTEEIAFRAFYCYLIGAQKRRDISFRLMEKYLGIQALQLDSWLEKESSFQKQVTGQRMSMTEIRDAIGNEVYPVLSLIEKKEAKKSLRRIQIYEDDGCGFTEEKSYFVPCRITWMDEEESTYAIHFTIQSGEEAKQLRIDPAFFSCIAEHILICVDGKKVNLQSGNIKLNGDLISEHTVLFETVDPAIILSIIGKHEITVSMELTRMPIHGMEIMKQLGKGKEKNTRFGGLFR